MQTQQIIEASATVITITQLRKGDVYKRIDTSGASYGSPLRFGVVQDVMNNGSESAFTALELTPTYAAVNAELKVWRGNQDIAIFAATPEEFLEHTTQLRKAAQQKVDAAEKALNEAHQTALAVEVSMKFVEDGRLTAPAVTTREIMGDEVPA